MHMTIELLREVQTDKAMLARLEDGQVVTYKGGEFCILPCGTFQFNVIDADVKVTFVKGTLNNGVPEMCK